MKKKKVAIIVISSIMAVVIAVTSTAVALKIDILGFVRIVSVMGVMIVGTALLPNPPKPEITYGEFPISVTFEVDGEIKVVEDTVICEFDGFESLGAAGKYRKWKEHLKSGNERLTIFKIDDTAEIYCWYKSPDYYMGDLRYGTREPYEQSREEIGFLSFVRWEDNKEVEIRSIAKDEAWEKYKLKIIDVKYSQPIQNTFK